MNFSEKVKKQKQKEKEVFRLSCELIEETALGSGGKNNRKKAMSDRQSDQLINAINQVTDYYDIAHIEIPKNAIEDDGLLDTVLGRTGLTRRKVALSRKWWIRGEGPVIAYNPDGDIICLVPLKFGGYSYVDPKTGEVVRINRRTALKISGEGYCFYKPFPTTSMSIKDFIKYILKTFTKFDIAFLMVLALAAALLGLVSPLINQLIFNTIIPSGTIQDIYPLMALMIGVMVATTAVNLFQTLWILRIGDKIQFGTQGALWIRLLNLPIKFFKKFSSGDLAVRTFTLSSICQTLSSSLIPTVLSAVFSFVYLGQIASLSPTLLMPTILIIALMLANSLINGWLNTRLNKKACEYSPKLSGLVYQLFTGVSKIKLAGAEVRAFSKWADIYSKLAQIKFNPNLFIKISGAISSVISFGGTMLIYFIVYQNNLAPADYIAFNTAFGAFSSAIMQISSIVLLIANLKPSIELLEPILKETPESNESKERIDNVSGKIDINNLKFRYTPDGPLIINGLNLSIKPGEYLGIVGSTGCGKSTLFRLLLGFEEPESGAIFYDDQNLKNLDLHSVRRNIGIVLQNGSMFSDSIFSNITITNPTATLDDAWAAAEKAGCAEDIKAMPMGMHTMVAEEGGGLSGGQKQRIMIARALISSPNLLMFDEATSALDNITQATVVETLSKMDITRIVIAHRLSTIKQCDRIVYLHKGQVVEEGTYDELMEKDGYFAELAKRQIV